MSNDIINKLIEFFDKRDFSNKFLKICEGVTIVDLDKCIKSHLHYVVNNVGNRTYKIYYDRLLLIKDIIENEPERIKNISLLEKQEKIEIIKKEKVKKDIEKVKKVKKVKEAKKTSRKDVQSNTNQINLF